MCGGGLKFSLFLLLLLSLLLYLLLPNSLPNPLSLTLSLNTKKTHTQKNTHQNKDHSLSTIFSLTASSLMASSSVNSFLRSIPVWTLAFWADFWFFIYFSRHPYMPTSFTFECRYLNSSHIFMIIYLKYIPFAILPKGFYINYSLVYYYKVNG